MVTVTYANEELSVDREALLGLLDASVEQPVDEQCRAALYELLTPTNETCTLEFKGSSVKIPMCYLYRILTRSEVERNSCAELLNILRGKR